MPRSRSAGRRRCRQETAQTPNPPSVGLLELPSHARRVPRRPAVPSARSAPVTRLRWQPWRRCVRGPSSANRIAGSSTHRGADGKDDRDAQSATGAAQELPNRPAALADVRGGDPAVVNMVVRGEYLSSSSAEPKLQLTRARRVVRCRRLTIRDKFWGCGREVTIEEMQPKGRCPRPNPEPGGVTVTQLPRLVQLCTYVYRIVTATER
jgi:hypothetical protein